MDFDSDMIGEEVLDTKMVRNDARAKTVRDYLKRLLKEVWEEEECFNGKRPFGNSGWQKEVAESLVKAGIMKGRMDEDGYLDDYDQKELDHLVLAAIEALE